MMLSPMLAPQLIPNNLMLLRYPLLVSKKLDGIRCLVQPFVPQLMTRNGKPIPNKRIWEAFDSISKLAHTKGVIFDGEIWSPKLKFQEIQSLVMTQDKSLPQNVDFGIYVFDAIPLESWNKGGVPKFSTRVDIVHALVQRIPYALALPQVLVTDHKILKDIFEKEILGGGEGLMLRNPNGGYKHGRCTYNEGTIYKLKAFEIATGVIVGVNEATGVSEFADRERDSFGYLKHVSKQDDRVGKEMLGSIVVDHNGQHFSIGSGWDHVSRKKLWLERNGLIGKKVEFKYSVVGVKNLPRFPIFLRFV